MDENYANYMCVCLTVLSLSLPLSLSLSSAGRRPELVWDCPVGAGVQNMPDVPKRAGEQVGGCLVEVGVCVCV